MFIVLSIYASRELSNRTILCALYIVSIGQEKERHVYCNPTVRLKPGGCHYFIESMLCALCSVVLNMAMIGGNGWPSLTIEPKDIEGFLETFEAVLDGAARNGS